MTAQFSCFFFFAINYQIPSVLRENKCGLDSGQFHRKKKKKTPKELKYNFENIYECFHSDHYYVYYRT